MALSELKSLIQSDLDQVERLIESKLNREVHSKIRSINQYVYQGKGKRIRPSLAILVFKMCTVNRAVSSNNHKQLIKIAAAIELIHMASLVHDDVIDHAPVRHNQPSLYGKYGIDIAVPMGVYLYSIALQLIAESGNIPCLEIISHAVKVLCAGELGQVLDRKQLITVPQYLAILKKKTGILFAAACRCGAILAEMPKQDEYRIKHYGSYLGLAFQISDDIMDILGVKETLKKEPGQDFELGEITLPLLYLLEEKADPTLKAQIFSGDLTQLNKIQKQIKASPIALPRSEEVATDYLERAIQALKPFETSQYQLALGAIVSYIKETRLTFTSTPS